MGMFDSIVMKVECPYCEQESVMESQTKELECALNTYREGEFISNQFKYLVCITSCHSKPCMAWEIKKCGYRSGFGRSFYTKIFIENDKISGKYDVVEEEN